MDHTRRFTSRVIQWYDIIYSTLYSTPDQVTLILCLYSSLHDVGSGLRLNDGPDAKLWLGRPWLNLRCPQCVIVIFLDHTHLLFEEITITLYGQQKFCADNQIDQLFSNSDNNRKISIYF